MQNEGTVRAGGPVHARQGSGLSEQMGDMVLTHKAKVLTHNTGAWRAACWPRFPVCSGRPISYKVLSKDALLL